MKGIIIYLHLETYLRQWLTHRLGTPVRFPDRSYENALLLRLISRPSGGSEPPTTICPPDSVPIIVPDCARRRPEYYCALTRRAQSQMARAVDNLFRLHLWSECAHLIHTRRLNQGLDEWCARQGIAIDYREAVRQKFYRMRRAYEEKGIFLRKRLPR